VLVPSLAFAAEAPVGMATDATQSTASANELPQNLFIPHLFRPVTTTAIVDQSNNSHH
jgi:hypothetical protein